MSIETKIECIRIGELDYNIRSLLDINQRPDVFAKNNDENTNEEVNDTNWPLFGVLWPAGRLLAETVNDMDLKGLRILEVGCGLALAGLVAHRKGADVIVSDFHPLAGEFLKHNLGLNDLSPLRYFEANWTKKYEELGLFDLIIASDVLYDRGHPSLLAEFMMQHLKDDARVILTDPGRQNYKTFSREMTAHGFTCTDAVVPLSLDAEQTAICHVLTYSRSAHR